MKIAFDAKHAFQNRTGLGNYSRYILEILCSYYPQHRYITYAPHDSDEERMRAMFRRFSFLTPSFPKGGLSVWWRVWSIKKDIRRAEIDVFHGLTGQLPLTINDTDAASVVTIHDLIFLRFPHYYNWIDRHIYAYKMRKACEIATKVIAISECTKRDIIHFFNICPEKIEVVYQGCDAVFSEDGDTTLDAQVRSRYQLPKDYVLSVGSIEERKNTRLLVRALPQLPQELELVLVGKRTPYTDAIEKEAKQLNEAQILHILSGVSFQDLPSIYRGASIFAYPSRYEGFGIPILEAQRSGLPVVAATGSCLEETGGDGALYVHPDDVDGVVHALLSIYTDETLRSTLIGKGREHARKFSEENQAHQLMEVYQKALSKKRNKHTQDNDR